MLLVIDTASGQQNLDLNLPWADGYRANYCKLGGDNNPRYKSSYYDGLVDRSRAIGYRVGHYWVPDTGSEPNGAADFYVNNLRNVNKTSDFFVLDNESYPGNDPDGPGPRRDSIMYTDEQAAAWVERVKARLSVPGNQVLVYYGLADARARTHDKVLATGANFIIAAYSYEPFAFAAPSNIPMSRIVGHQTGGKIWGGIPTDINSFTDNAFSYSPIPTTTEDEDMILIKPATATATRPWVLLGPGYQYNVPEAHVYLAKRYVSKVLDTLSDAEYDIIKAQHASTVKAGVSVPAVDPKPIIDGVVAALVPEVLRIVQENNPDIVIDNIAIAEAVRQKFRDEPFERVTEWR